MKRNYFTPFCQIIDINIESIMITNSNGQTGGTVPGMGWGNNGGNSGGTVPGMGWGAADKRSEWNEYENK